MRFVLLLLGAWALTLRPTGPHEAHGAVIVHALGLALVVLAVAMILTRFRARTRL